MCPPPNHWGGTASYPMLAFRTFITCSSCVTASPYDPHATLEDGRPAPFLPHPFFFLADLPPPTLGFLVQRRLSKDPPPHPLAPAPVAVLATPATLMVPGAVAKQQAAAAAVAAVAAAGMRPLRSPGAFGTSPSVVRRSHYAGRSEGATASSLPTQCR